MNEALRCDLAWQFELAAAGAVSSLASVLHGEKDPRHSFDRSPAK